MQLRITSVVPLLVPLLLAACGAISPRPDVVSETPTVETPSPKQPPKKSAKPSYVLKKGGGFYQDDGPGDNPPEDMDAIPDAVPRVEPLQKYANRPYSVLGKNYTPLRTIGNYKAQGIASWYGRKFHGQKTSSGEPYDMYGMTAAHPILPIPSYARVTSLATGKSVIVRVNDRGPFHADRVMDLSYTAAWKLGLVGGGSGMVVVESVVPGDPLSPPSAPASTPDPSERLARNEEPTQVPAASSAQASAASVPVKGTFIQLAAFGNPDNAESFRIHMGRELDWLADKLRTEVAGNVHRVQVGPFSTRAEAESAIARIVDRLGTRPTIVVR
ncbi:MAG TPA: septal ring lytic transglycosylase RlpA family protein [Rhodocyclaceae bacterium]|nr:septal ring lytic transglycosylase RlpA family protein [Rhodocyclaceae bacterium]